MSVSPSKLLLGGSMTAYGIAFVTSAMQALLLGPQGRGEVAVALVPGTLIGMLACFGLPDYLARQAALCDDPRALATTALTGSLALGAILFAPAVAFAYLQAPVTSDAWALLLVFACVNPLIIYGYCVAAIAGGRARWWRVVVARVTPGLVTTFGLIIVWQDSPSPLAVGLILIAGTLAGYAVNAFDREMRPTARHISVRPLRVALAFGARSWPAGALGLLNQRLDLLFLTVVATRTEVGLYALAVSCAAVLTAIPNALAAPARNAVAQGRRALASKRSAQALTATAVAAVGLILAFPLFVSFVVGEEFGGAYLPLILLAVAQVPLAGSLVLMLCLASAGVPGKAFIGTAGAFVATSIGIALLYPTNGILGVALAGLIGAFVSYLLLMHVSQRHIQRVPVWNYFTPFESRRIQ